MARLRVLTDMCLAYPGTGWLLGRKELLNLKRTTLLTLFKVFAHHGLEANRHYTYNQSTNIITFANDSQIFLFDLSYQPSDPLYTRLGDLELTGACIDESNEVPAAAIEIVKTRLGRRLNDKFGRCLASRGCGRCRGRRGRWRAASSGGGGLRGCGVGRGSRPGGRGCG
jgi:hypothetical protein